MKSLTDFAIDLYRASDVQAACLRLQDDFSADIPYLLFLCWYGSCIGHISDNLAANSAQHNQAISQQVVQPLRQARRWMKSHWQAQPALREKIKAAELQAELALLEELQQMAGTTTGTSQPGHAAIQANMLVYLGSLPVQPAKDIWEPILKGAADALRPATD